MSERVDQVGQLVARLIKARLHAVIGIRTINASGYDATGINEYCETHPEHVLLVARGINQCVADFNIQPPDTELLPATCRLKAQLPQLLTLDDIAAESENPQNRLRWPLRFFRGTKKLKEKIGRGEAAVRFAFLGTKYGGRRGSPDPSFTFPDTTLLDLDGTTQRGLVFACASVHPTAKTLAFGIHVYEETIAEAAKERGMTIGKDEITDAFIEMLILHHGEPEDPYYFLYQLVRNPSSDSEDTPGLGWVDGYDHLSPALRRMAGCS